MALTKTSGTSASMKIYQLTRTTLFSLKASHSPLFSWHIWFWRTALRFDTLRSSLPVHFTSTSWIPKKALRTRKTMLRHSQSSQQSQGRICRWAHRFKAKSWIYMSTLCHRQVQYSSSLCFLPENCRRTLSISTPSTRCGQGRKTGWPKKSWTSNIQSH